MWVLLDASDRSYCNVHEKNILQAGNVNIADTVKFYYQGKEYTGIVLNKNENYEVINAELTMLRKRPRAAAGSSKAPADQPVLGSRRRSQKTTSTTTSSNVAAEQKQSKINNAPKMSEDEKSRQRILELNKKEAERRANNLILSQHGSKKKKNDEEDDWMIPSDNDDVSQDSDVDTAAHRISQEKRSRNNLIQSLNKINDRSSSSSAGASPSREDLLQQIKLLQKQLADKGNQGNSKSHLFDEPLIEEENGDTHDHSIIDSNTGNKDENDSSKLGNNEREASADVSSGGGGGDQSFGGNSSFDSSNLEHQLYGKMKDTTEIAKNIFCKSDVLTRALTSSHNVSHLLRRMLTGVFIPSAMTNCTVTGQSWRAGGPDKCKEEKEPLHSGALKGIFDFANEVAKKKQWHIIKSLNKAKSIWAVRLTEVRNAVKKGKMKD